MFPELLLVPQLPFSKGFSIPTDTNDKSTILSMESVPSSNKLLGDNNNAADEDSNNITSVSYFQKTIFLQDWWLIKADNDGEGEKLGVAGFPSREQPALRLFSSAPITKYYDMFTLETMDGLCVVLNGLINKSRTLENGFSSEVFTHFIMGFPPYWEHFAESYLRRGSSAGVVSREDAGVEDCGNMTLETGQRGTASNESSEPKFNTDSDLNSNDLRNSKNLGDDVIVDTARGSPPPKTSSFNNDTSPTVNKSVLVESSPVVENSHTCVDDTTVQCEVLSELERTGASTDINKDVNVSMKSNERNNCEFENFSGYKKESASSGCGATMHKSKTRSSVAKARLGNPEKMNSNSKPLNFPVDFGVGRDFDEAATYSEGRILTQKFSKSKRKEGDQKAVGVLEDERTKINRIPVGTSDQTENVDADVNRESTRRKDGTQKKTKKAGGSTSRRGVADKKHCSKIAVEVKETVSEVSTSAEKIARKLTYGSPVKEGKEEASIIPIESFSSKRSRSGRLLLPSLEFWRNQTLVYDRDRRITGIKEDRCTVQPSRGSKSEPLKKKSKPLV